jgi:AbrB family looped-hinge helix DNA binding protein
VPETRVDEFGRIVIPKRIRTRFGLERGSVLEITESEEGIVLRPGKAEPPVVETDGVLVFTGTPTGDLDQALERHREDRLRSMGRPLSASKP